MTKLSAIIPVAFSNRAEATKQIEMLQVKLSAMQQERDFWCEQARVLQNQLQSVFRGQAAILDQMAHNSVMPDDVHAAISDMGAQLRHPLTTVEAAVALSAASRMGSQGAYTAVNTDTTRRDSLPRNARYD